MDRYHVSRSSALMRWTPAGVCSFLKAVSSLAEGSQRACRTDVGCAYLDASFPASPSPNACQGIDDLNVSFVIQPVDLAMLHGVFTL